MLTHPNVGAKGHLWIKEMMTPRLTRQTLINSVSQLVISDEGGIKLKLHCLKLYKVIVYSCVTQTSDL